MIKLENIKKSFHLKDKTLDVLKGINLEISQGEYVAIQGKSGSGKSTLLNVIGLLDVADEGNYYLDGTLIRGREVGGYSRYRQEYFGFIFQSYHLISSLTVKQNIELPFIYRSDSPNADLIAEYSEALKISDILNSVVKNLSGGEKQRVAILRAIITNPHIVICDEPTGNLDDENTRAVLDAFDMLKKTGKTLIMVTHNHAVARRADKSYFLDNGVLNEYEENI